MALQDHLTHFILQVDKQNHQSKPLPPASEEIGLLHMCGPSKPQTDKGEGSNHEEITFLSSPP